MIIHFGSFSSDSSFKKMLRHLIYSLLTVLLALNWVYLTNKEKDVLSGPNLKDFEGNERKEEGYKESKRGEEVYFEWEKVERFRIRSNRTITEKNQFYSNYRCLGFDPNDDPVASERRSCVFENVCLDLSSQGDKGEGEVLFFYYKSKETRGLNMYDYNGQLRKREKEKKKVKFVATHFTNPKRKVFARFETVNSQMPTKEGFHSVFKYVRSNLFLKRGSRVCRGVFCGNFSKR